MTFLFILSLILLAVVNTIAYYKLFKKEEPKEYIWVGKGENPLKNMK